MKHDQLIKFMFASAPIRGHVVQLADTWQAVLSRHEFPAPVVALLGEMMAAAALLSSTLKFDGALIMQLHGDGPVRLLVAECNADLTLRATAKLADEAHIATSDTLQSLVNQHGQARMAITLDPREKLPGQQPYQGIVPVEGESIAQMLEHYMARSEQIDTRLWLAADNASAGGLLLQRMPGDGGHQPVTVDADAWDRALHLAQTVKSQELLSVAPTELLHRLFWQEEGVRLFEPASPRFACTCSRERVGEMLLRLGRSEIESVLSERGQIDVQCEFCGAAYVFDAVDAAQLVNTGNAGAIRQPENAQRH